MVHLKLDLFKKEMYNDNYYFIYLCILIKTVYIMTMYVYDFILQK